MKKIVSIFILVIAILVSGYLLVLSSKSVIVNVKIDPPFQAEGYLSDNEQIDQRARISKNVNSVISDLHKNLYFTFGLKKFEFIPSFSVRLSGGAYEYLLKHPLVSGIEEDKPIGIGDCSKGAC